MALLTERYKIALEMRESGYTYKDIGERIGASPSRARGIVESAKWKMRHNYGELSELSARARNCLFFAEYETKEQVMQGVKSGAISPYGDHRSKIPNYGKKAHKEVCEWLGLDLVHPDKTKPYPHKSIDKARALLERHGYTVIAPLRSSSESQASDTAAAE